MRKHLFAVLVAGAGIFAAQAASAQDRTDCLRVGQIDGFSAIKGDDKAFVVTDRLHRRFKINLMYRCGGLDYNMALGFKTLGIGRLACISRGDTVFSRDVGQVGNRCPVSSVVPYTPAMEAADKAAFAAKSR
jgi:hypothetical protein